LVLALFGSLSTAEEMACKFKNEERYASRLSAFTADEEGEREKSLYLLEGRIGGWQSKISLKISILNAKVTHKLLKGLGKFDGGQ